MADYGLTMEELAAAGCLRSAASSATAPAATRTSATSRGLLPQRRGAELGRAGRHARLAAAGGQISNGFGYPQIGWSVSRLGKTPRSAPHCLSMSSVRLRGTKKDCAADALATNFQNRFPIFLFGFASLLETSQSWAEIRIFCGILQPKASSSSTKIRRSMRILITPCSLKVTFSEWSGRLSRATVFRVRSTNRGLKL